MKNLQSRIRGRTLAESGCLWMTYDLAFRAEAKKEWDGLGQVIRAHFKKKLAERLEKTTHMGRAMRVARPIV